MIHHILHGKQALWKLPSGKIVKEIEFGKYIDPKTGKKKLITKSMVFILKKSKKRSKKRSKKSKSRKSRK